LEHAVLLELTSGRVLLGFERDSVPHVTATSQPALQTITAAVRQGLGTTDTEVELVVLQQTDQSTTLAAIHREEREQAVREAQKRVQAHPRVVEAMQLLGARLKQVRLPQ
jgi:hypothetical protein